jgi:hypothetical protein
MKNIIFIALLLCFAWGCKTIETPKSIFEERESITGIILGKTYNMSRENGWDITIGSGAQKFKPNYWDGYEKIVYGTRLIKAFDANNIMKGSENIYFRMPTVPFKEQEFEKLKQIFAVGSKIFKDSTNQDTGFELTFGSIFPMEDSKTIGGSTTLGSQAGSKIEVLAQREVPVTDAGAIALGYTKSLEVVILVNCKLYDKDRKYIGDMQNLRIQLKILHKIFTQ